MVAGRVVHEAVAVSLVANGLSGVGHGEAGAENVLGFEEE